MQTLIGISIGRYHILEQLGEGGMATVYKAYDTRLERPVAIKVIRTDQFAPAVLEQVLRRFEREAKALAQLSHPNIVHVHDYGEYEDAPYLVMEYLPGGVLKSKLGTAMPWREAVRLLLPIAQALAYAHEHNIVHRDVKPSNILLTDKGQPMLSDFGIAKILENEQTAGLTTTGMGVGTPEYMAPEQWTGQAGPLADLYSLGVVLYELVTGRKPYTADTPAAIMLKQANDPLPRPRQFAPDLPESVEKVLFKALAKSPDDRYEGMGEFTVALESLISGHKLPADVQPEQTKQVEQATLLVGGAGRQAIPSTPKVSAPPRRRLKLGKTGGWVAVIGFLVVVCILFVALGFGLLKLAQRGIGPLTGFVDSLATSTQIPTGIPTASEPSSTETIPPTEAPTPAAGSTRIRPADGLTMVYIPEGFFRMGQTAEQAVAECRNFFNDCQLSWFSDEQPPHDVTLDAYWIDRTEVTNAVYAKCVDSGACQPPGDISSQTRTSYYGNPQYADYPIINIDWGQAYSYCAWASGRLPSEAEWEKAARSMDWRTYPWGNNLPSCSLANYGEPQNCSGDTTPSDGYASGASPYGAINMAGNVSEWVNDWYSDNLYAQPQVSNPTGPETGTERVMRGGAWNLNPNFLRTTNRDHQSPDTRNDYIGFRCAGSP